MSDVLDRLRKKRGHPIDINGEVYHGRSLTIGELRRLDALPPDNKTGFLVGCALCSDSEGAPEIPKASDEDDVKWSERVLLELSDVPTEVIRAFSDGVGRIGTTPKLEAVAKNLPGTQPQDSPPA